MKYIPYVNVKSGTRNNIRFSHGNTLPLTQRPFGMISFCPQTDAESRWYYSPDLPVIEGIRLTHQPSPWIGDYATILFTPQIDVISDTPRDAWSGYRIENSINQPHYMKYKFLRPSCNFELVPSERGAIIRLEYESELTPYFSCLPVLGDYTYRYDSEKNILFVTSNGHSQDDAVDFKAYFVLAFDKDGVDKENIIFRNNCAHIPLRAKKTEIRVALSYISEEMALLALEREIGEKSLEELKKEGEDAWESYLSRIEIEADEHTMRTFYSCMYRSFLFPHKAYELDGDGAPLHYSPYDGRVHSGPRYTDSGFWDTYRTLYPLYTLIARREYAEMLRGFIGDYKEGGYLPRWLSIGEVGCMPSTLIDGVIAEACTQKIVPEDVLSDALEGMLHHANVPAKSKKYGREGIEHYLKYGYVPSDMCRESVNLTLDFAYGDWCIASVAKALGKRDIYEKYLARSKSYKSLFDPETKFIRARKANGEYEDDFDPIKWGGAYTEACAWQSTLAVQHDIDGLCELFGGKDGLEKYLDDLFSAKPDYRVNTYGSEIHEMTEMALCDLGQCAISNQPSFHIPYIYAYLGKTDKCKKWVDKICDEYFTYTENAYPGDEDNGSMSAWYILSSIGMYRLTPGKDEWIRIAPRVKIKNIKQYKI